MICEAPPLVEQVEEEIPWVARRQNFPPLRSRLVVVHLDIEYVIAVYRHYHLRGWEVYPAKDGPDARRLARELSPLAVILGADLPHESGWLTCFKLHEERADQKIILVDDEVTSHAARFSSFLGAAGLIRRADGMGELAQYVWETAA